MNNIQYKYSLLESEHVVDPQINIYIIKKYIILNTELINMYTLLHEYSLISLIVCITHSITQYQKA